MDREVKLYLAVETCAREAFLRFQSLAFPVKIPIVRVEVVVAVGVQLAAKDICRDVSEIKTRIMPAHRPLNVSELNARDTELLHVHEAFALHRFQRPSEAHGERHFVANVHAEAQ